MTPDDFLKDLAQTASADQGLAGFRTMATMLATFYAGLVADNLEPDVAVELTVEFMRCTIGDHKPV